MIQFAVRGSPGSPGIESTRALTPLPPPKKERNRIIKIAVNFFKVISQKVADELFQTFPQFFF